MKYIYILLCLLTLSCARERIDVVPEARPYFDKFRVRVYETRGIKIDDIIVEFGSLNLNPEHNNGQIRIAVCQVMNKSYEWDGPVPYTYTTNRVVLDRKYWFEALSNKAKEQVMFHELVHCILGRGHNDKYFPNGIPYSVMNTYHFSSSMYTSYYNHYMRELFGYTGDKVYIWEDYE